MFFFMMWATMITKTVVKKAEAWREIASLSFEHIGLVRSNVFLYDVGHNDYKNRGEEGRSMAGNC